MPCYNPILGYRSRVPNENGKYPIVFSQANGYVDKPVKVPCGKCIGCRLEHSRQWAIRCVHEASLYDDNCFITLTYRDADLPHDMGLDVSHFQKFMKRLRKKFVPKNPYSKVDQGELYKEFEIKNAIRFFQCGEYGEATKDNNWIARPHYHACIFNFDFEDKVFWKEKDGTKLYISETLSELWPYGWSTIGNVTFESAAYVARYIMKKINGDMAERINEEGIRHYERLDRSTGEVFKVKPEYTTMSRRPGIASRWFDQFKDDCYPSDTVVLRGKEMKPPKFYDKLYQIDNPDEFERIKAKRVAKAKQHKEDNTFERLRTREKVKKAQIKMLVREIE